MKTVLLGDVAKYVTEKVAVSDVTLQDYVSTENLLPDKGGLALAAKLPESGKVTRYNIGDILVSNIRPYFKKIWFAKNEGGSSNDVLVFRPITDDLDNKYLYYVLANDRFFDYSTASSGGSKMPRGDKIQILKYPVHLPDLDEQKRVADILIAIDEKIELNRRMNKTLEKIGKTLFKHYFIYNPEAKTWSNVKIGEIAEVTDYVANGSFASLKENVTLYDTPNYALYIRTTDYKGGFKNNLKYVDKESYDFLKKTVLDGSEFIISNVGDVGTVFKAPVWLNLPMTLASNVIMVRNSIYNNYLYLYFRTPDGQFALSNIVAGSAQPKFNKTEFRNLNIRVPSDKYLKQFNDQYDLISSKIVNLNSEMQTLTDLRDSILPRLVSGKLKV